MDDDFHSDNIQTPCMSDTVEDFTQIQTAVHSSADYDIPVFAPSFDTADGGYIVNHPNELKTGPSTSGQVEEKVFIENDSDSIMDIQLYDSLQNHHNYSLKTVKTKNVEDVKQNENSGHDIMNDSLTCNVSYNNDQDDDAALDISDPLKEICRSSSPLFLPSQTEEEKAFRLERQRVLSIYRHLEPSSSRPIPCGDGATECSLTENQIASIVDEPILVKGEKSHKETKLDLTPNEFETHEKQINSLDESEIVISFNHASKQCQLDTAPTSNDHEAMSEPCGILSKSAASLSSETDFDNAHNLDKIGHDKTMFSENLGLMPKESSDLKMIQEKVPERKGVQTRRSLSALKSLPSFGPVKIRDKRGPVQGQVKNSANSGPTQGQIKNLPICGPVKGHKHPRGPYKCGSCNQTFVNICKLHQHLEDHSSGGSYHYNHILKTAFPKFDMVCGYTQTEEKITMLKPQLKPLGKPFGKGIKLKDKKKKDKNILRVERKKVLSAYEIHRHLDPSCDQSTNNEEIEEQPVTIKVTVEKRKKRGRPSKVENDEFDKRAKHYQKTTGMEVCDVSIEQKMDEIDENQEQLDELNQNIIDHDGKTAAQFEEDHLDMNKEIENIETNTEGERPVVNKPIKAAIGKSSKRKMSTPRKVLTEDVKCPKFEFKFICDFCPLKFFTSGTLLRHVRLTHSKEMKFPCDICKQKFMISSSLERHKALAHDKGKKMKTARKKALKEKKMRGKKKLEDSEETFNCEICGQLLSKSKAEVHVRLHTGERPFICHKCGKGLISEKKLKRHLLIHSDAKRHTCDVCGEGFAIKYKLRTHMSIHTGHKPYLCSVCGAEFNNGTSLQHHHRIVHLGDKRFECNICGGRYGKKSQLEEHMFSHSNERTQTCRYCGKTFKHAKSLRRHEATHVSDTKFSCDQCDSQFSRKDNLERHKMVHLQATLKCKFCKKKFTDRSLLSDHEQFHINQRKYQCQICKEKFQNDAYFYSHMEKSHDMNRERVEMMNLKQQQKQAQQEALSNKDMLSHGIVMDIEETVINQSGAIATKQHMLLDNQSGDITTKHHMLLDNQSDAITTKQHMFLGNQSGASNTKHHMFLDSQSGASTTKQDTLNYSMSVAGIIPSSSQDLISSTMSSAQIQPQTSIQTMQNQSLTSGQNIVITNGARTILNQPHNGNLTSSTQMIPRLNDSQRTFLTSGDNLILNEQQLIVQGALGSNINMQNPGFRMQNLF